MNARNISLYELKSLEYEHGLILEIPKQYKPVLSRKGDRISLHTIYPEMIGFSESLKDRFWDEDGVWGTDRIRIIIEIKDKDRPSDEDYINKNNLARMIYDNKLLTGDFRSQQMPKEIENNKNVTKFVHKEFHADQAYYYVKNDDRISVIGCIQIATCRGYTTFKEKAAITYQFKNSHINNVVNIDRSVINLVETFYIGHL